MQSTNDTCWGNILGWFWIIGKESEAVRGGTFFVTGRSVFLVAEEVAWERKQPKRGEGLERAFQREGAPRQREKKGLISLHFPRGKFFIVTPLLLYGFLSFSTFVNCYMLGCGNRRPTCLLLILGMNIRGSYIHFGWFLGFLFFSSPIPLIPFTHNLILPLIHCVAWWALWYFLFLS